jgi:hypothetical protein
MTDRVELPSLRTHFRIAEEEAEAAFIENVSLSLTLRSGRTLQLPPRQPPAGVITADRALDVDFDLPSGVEADQVTASAVEIVGYYRRYSEMLLQALARPSSSRH